MSVLDTLRRRAGGIAGGVQESVRRARLDGELRVLQRQRDAAFAHLGERAVELIRAGRLDATDLGPQVADVESKLMEIDAKEGQIEALRDDGEGTDPPPDERAAPGGCTLSAVLRRLLRRA